MVVLGMVSMDPKFRSVMTLTIYDGVSSMANSGVFGSVGVYGSTGVYGSVTLQSSQSLCVSLWFKKCPIIIENCMYMC